MCRVLSRDQLWARQQQLSGDHRLQQQGQRWRWLEDVVGIHTCVGHTRGLWLFTNELDKQSSLSHININTNTHMDLRLQLQTSEPAPPAAAGTGHDSEREKSKTFRTAEGYAESSKADKLKWKDDQMVRTILCYVITAETLGCCVKCKHILNTSNVQTGTFDYFMKKTTENIWI